MKKEFIVCYAVIGVLILLCVTDVILGMWLNLICNTMWVIVEYTVLLSGKRLAEKRRELLEQELLNEKICYIIADFAVDLGRESEAFDRIRKARQEAYNESLAMIEELESQNNCGTDDFIESKRIAYKQVKDGVLEMQEIVSMQEEPVSEDFDMWYEKEWIPFSHSSYTEKDILKEAYKAGARWQKQQMMKDAISCKVEWFGGLCLEYTQKTLDEILSKKGIKEGEKVKVLVIKKD